MLKYAFFSSKLINIEDDYRYLNVFVYKKRQMTDIFNICVQNIDCGYTLEPPQQF